VRFVAGHPNTKGTFQLPCCGDRQNPAVVSAKFEHTIITNELTHRLNFWSASRYAYDVILSISHTDPRVVFFSLENLDDDLDQLRTQGYHRRCNVPPGAKSIDRRGLRKRTLLGGHKNHFETENSGTHIHVRARDVCMDQITSAGSR